MRKLRFKNSRKFLLLRLVGVVTFAVGFAVYSFWSKENNPSHVFLVKVPREYSENFSNEELLQYYLEGNAIPISSLENRNLSLPHSCGHIIVSLEKDGKIKLNSQEYGDLESLNTVKQQLEQTFQRRAENGIFEEGSNKIIKKVFIKLSRSAKYGDVVKVIDAVKETGADPINLQIDDLPE
jgi:biopolymer transport protein ExbD